MAAKAAAYLVDDRLDEAIEAGEEALATRRAGRADPARHRGDPGLGPRLRRPDGRGVGDARRTTLRAAELELEAEAARGYRLIGSTASTSERVRARRDSGSTRASSTPTAPSSGTTGTTWPPTWRTSGGARAVGRRRPIRAARPERAGGRDHHPHRRPARRRLRRARPRTRRIGGPVPRGGAAPRRRDGRAPALLTGHVGAGRVRGAARRPRRGGGRSPRRGSRPPMRWPTPPACSRSSSPAPARGSRSRSPPPPRTWAEQGVRRPPRPRHPGHPPGRRPRRRPDPARRRPHREGPRPPRRRPRGLVLAGPMVGGAVVRRRPGAVRPGIEPSYRGLDARRGGAGRGGGDRRAARSWTPPASWRLASTSTTPPNRGRRSPSGSSRSPAWSRRG